MKVEVEEAAFAFGFGCGFVIAIICVAILASIEVERVVTYQDGVPIDSTFVYKVK